jgi:uncharacterized protein (DUF779 family)
MLAVAETWDNGKTVRETLAANKRISKIAFTGSTATGKLIMMQSEFKVGLNDVFLGFVGNKVPFYMSSSEFDYWKHTQLVIDVVQGGGNAFSLESPEGISFHTCSNIFTDDEMKALDAQGEPSEVLNILHS